MSTSDQLLLDLGQSAGLAQPLRFDEHGCARLLVDGHLAIDFERDDDAGLLQVYSVLGPLPAQGREALLMQLLQANLFGADTGGAALAVDGDTDEVVLCRGVAAEDLAAPAFVQWIERLVAVAEHWKDRLAAWRPDADAAAGPNGGTAAAAAAPAPQAAPLGAFLRA